MRRLLPLLVLALPFPAHAQDCAGPVVACGVPMPGALALLSPGQTARVVVSADDDAGVRRAAADLVADLKAVGGGSAALSPDARDGATVIAGTLGHSAAIDALVRAGKLDVSGLAGQWEGYVEQVVDHPAPGVARALVVAGSDRRGTIFGLYDISAKAGVSPWTWWADVPAQRHPTWYLTAGRVADHPIVKYRGIFINDEEPAFGGWARATFGGVNHRAYERLFTLLLRSRANYLWPAMWGKSLWQDDPATAPLATEMGIILGTSHHEPMERANIEWKRQGGGAWDYATNAPALRAFWRQGIERRGPSEDPVTIGMRGDGDEPMTKGTAIPLLERIVTDQRAIIADVSGRPPAQTPQVWALYKEVQDYYDGGMRVPEDVTLLFSDDNWGNIRRLPPPGEVRAGGSGVYYHFDYVGDPRNYKWIDTVSIPRVWQQMAMADRYGADRLWIVNVGDLKPLEYATSFFLDMAWNPGRMTLGAMEAYPVRWAAQQFGAAQAGPVGAMIARYGQLASRRKPELIDADSYALADGSWARVLADWNMLAAAAHREAEAIPADRRDAYDELVLHRIDAMASLHRLYEAVAENRAAARAGDDAAAVRWAASTRGYFAEDGALRRRYESLGGGKWPQMMAQTHIGYTGWQEPAADVMPALASVAAPLPIPATEPAPFATLAADAGRPMDGAGFHWQMVPNFTAGGAAMAVTPVAAAPIEHPGGVSPQIVYPVTLPPGRMVSVSVVAAPGLDVRGTRRQRLALSIDAGAPVPIDLLAGDDDSRWRGAVSDNRRIATAILPVARSGRHALHLWLVDPQVVVERLEIELVR
ncbi:glycosyl hydrolase 115 family protein [Sphingomonas sp. CROZ-RG-20F-R02-07]|uniref:glycosyl hydrolase 115 family protein n=1 Tax=Sphingomonas sp. CROZ-RG-20F-R02-07 TaxID=2914832 RepID=UPI001F57036B|nr:glycosyl hydrolase 115 family protein [Sphingomonas sp. CROZ-RG-20F-R02-07]